MLMELNWIVGMIASAATAVFGWVIGRRKTNAEASITEMEAVSAAIKIWRDTAENLSKDVMKLREDIDDHRKQLKEMKLENRKLQQAVRDLSEQNAELRKIVAKMTEQNSEYKRILKNPKQPPNANSIHNSNKPTNK